MSPKRWDGLTPSDVSNYDPLPAREFLNPLYGIVDIVDETFAIPTSGMWSLNHIVHGNPLVASNLIISSGGNGSGSVYQPQLIAPSTNYTVKVIPATGMLEFFSGDAGNIVYANYKAHVSNIDMSTIAQMYAAIRSGSSASGGGQYIAGENVVAGCGYIDGANVYQASPAELTKCGWVWITAAANTGASVLCQTSGMVSTPRAGIPASTPLYCGQNGAVTWWADVDAAAKLTPGQYAHCIGVSMDGINILLNTVQDATRFSE